MKTYNGAFIAEQTLHKHMCTELLPKFARTKISQILAFLVL